MAAASRVCDVVAAAAERTPVPCVVEIEAQRRVRGYRRLQTLRGLPGAKAHARHALAVRPGRMERHAVAGAGDHEALSDESPAR